jgi:hypothetical protein
MTKKALASGLSIMDWLRSFAPASLIIDPVTVLGSLLASRWMQDFWEIQASSAFCLEPFSFFRGKAPQNNPKLISGLTDAVLPDS